MRGKLAHDEKRNINKRLLGRRKVTALDKLMHDTKCITKQKAFRSGKGNCAGQVGTQ